MDRPMLDYLRRLVAVLAEQPRCDDCGSHPAFPDPGTKADLCNACWFTSRPMFGPGEKERSP
jgi:hypothetical protein